MCKGRSAGRLILRGYRRYVVFSDEEGMHANQGGWLADLGKNKHCNDNHSQVELLVVVLISLNKALE
jgi:hypothetical protein